MATREGRKYAGSTSSLSGLLSQLYYLISGDKFVNTAGLSRRFRSGVRISNDSLHSLVSLVRHSLKHSHEVKGERFLLYCSIATACT